jgi:hypothetical protein
MDKICELHFNDTNDGCTFELHPFIHEYNSASGSISVLKDKWDELLIKLNRSKNTVLTYKVYAYRDLEYSVVDHDQDQSTVDTASNLDSQIVHKRSVYAGVHDRQLLTIFRGTLVDNDSFPKLSVYHDEYTREVRGYRFGSVCLNFIAVDKPAAPSKYNYIVVSFQYKKNLKESIIKDLKYINKVIN